MTGQDEGKTGQARSVEHPVGQAPAPVEDWAAALPHFSSARKGMSPPPRRRWRLRWLFFSVFLSIALGSGFLALTGRGIALPHWAITQLEKRLNQSLAASHLPEGTQLSLGGLEVALDRDFEPQFILRDSQIGRAHV